MEAPSPVKIKEDELISNKEYELHLNDDIYSLVMEINNKDTIFLKLKQINDLCFYNYNKQYKYEELIDLLLLPKKYYDNIPKIYKFIDTAITKNKLTIIKEYNTIKLLLKKMQEFDEIDCVLDMHESKLTNEEILKDLFNEIKKIKSQVISNHPNKKGREVNVDENINTNVNSLMKEIEEVKNKVSKVKSKNKDLKKKLDLLIDENKKIKEENDDLKKNNIIIIDENKKLQNTINEYKNYYDESINDLKNEINNLNKNRTKNYYIIGEKGMINSHPHELVFSRYYKKAPNYQNSDWFCDICNKSFKFTVPNFYCPQCGNFDVCNYCFQKYKCNNK